MGFESKGGVGLARLLLAPPPMSRAPAVPSAANHSRFPPFGRRLGAHARQATRLRHATWDTLTDETLGTPDAGRRPQDARRTTSGRAPEREGGGIRARLACRREARQQRLRCAGLSSDRRSSNFFLECACSSLDAVFQKNLGPPRAAPLTASDFKREKHTYSVLQSSTARRRRVLSWHGVQKAPDSDATTRAPGMPPPAACKSCGDNVRVQHARSQDALPPGCHQSGPGQMSRDRMHIVRRARWGSPASKRSAHAAAQIDAAHRRRPERIGVEDMLPRRLDRSGKARPFEAAERASRHSRCTAD